MSEPSSTWERVWPEVFASLDAKTRAVVVGVLANHALEGMEPDRESVTNLVAYTGGAISEGEYDRRADARAARMTAAPASAAQASAGVFPGPATEAVRTPPELGDTARAQPSREQDYGRGADHGR